MKITFILFLTLLANSAFGQNDEDDDLPIKIVKSGNKYFLKDSSQRRLSSNYDSLNSDRNYYFGYINNKVDVFTKDKAKKVLKGIRAIYYVPSTFRVYQVLKNNKLLWLDSTQKLLEKDPNDYRVMGVCGTVSDYISRVYRVRDSTFFILTVTEPVANPKAEYVHNINITSMIGKSELTFLNRLNFLKFDDNSFFQNGLDNYTFIEKTENKKYNIIRLEILKNVARKIIFVEQIDKVFINSGDRFKPFIYEKNGLLGYYPINKFAKYQFLNPLDKNFTRFVLPTGKKGWLDKNGKEYLDE